MRKPTQAEAWLYARLAVGVFVLTMVLIVGEVGFNPLAWVIGAISVATGAICALPVLHAMRPAMLGDGEDKWSQ